MNFDQLTANFLDQNGNIVTSIKNVTSYSLDSDFFMPADGFTLEIGDDRADQLNKNINIGSRVAISINDNPQLIGYVDKIQYSYNRGGGKILHIQGRDALGTIGDSICHPSLKLAQDDTTITSLNKIFDIGSSWSKGYFNNSNPYGLYGLTSLSIDDRFSATKAIGGNVGIKARTGKTLRSLVKNLQHAIDHLIRPRHEEGIMQFAQRIAHQSGLEIKLARGGTFEVLINSPIYTRDTPPLYQLIKQSNNPKNNVITGSMDVNWTKQPTVIVGEVVASGGLYRKEDRKVICINELTGYQRGLAPTLDNALPQVKEFVNSTTTKYGYYLMEPNVNLITSIPNTIINLIPSTYRPMFLYDENIASFEELKFAVAKKMAQYQNDFFTLHYTVENHTNNGNIWQPNQLVNVIDDTFDPNNSVGSVYWIKRVTFTKSRGGGTKTNLELKLPFIYAFEQEFNNAKTTAVTSGGQTKYTEKSAVTEYPTYPQYLAINNLPDTQANFINWRNGTITN